MHAVVSCWLGPVQSIFAKVPTCRKTSPKKKLPPTQKQGFVECKQAKMRITSHTKNTIFRRGCQFGTFFLWRRKVMCMGEKRLHRITFLAHAGGLH